MSDPANRKFQFRKNSPFSVEESTFIIFQYGKLKHTAAVRRALCGVVWGLENPDVVVPCKKAHGAKVMAWVGIVDGQVLPVHWFSGSV